LRSTSSYHLHRADHRHHQQPEAIVIATIARRRAIAIAAKTNKTIAMQSAGT
jgi:hypothetical protein